MPAWTQVGACLPKLCKQNDDRDHARAPCERERATGAKGGSGLVWQGARSEGALAIFLP